MGGMVAHEQPAPTAILVLGAKVRPSARPGAALARRIAAAAEVARAHPQALVIACGGRAWHGAVEADVIARALIEVGIDPARVERDRLSMTTVENLREGVARARARGRDTHVALVTCDWHVARAVTVARVLGLHVTAVAAPSHGMPLRHRLAHRVRERLLRAFAGLLVLLALTAIACHKPQNGAGSTEGGPPSSMSSAAPSTSPSELVAARVASDRRVSSAVAASLSSSGDVAARRAAARALAQIADAAAIERLGKSLSDDDPEVVAWSAYGLGVPCDVEPTMPREDRAKLVRAVVARALTLEGRALGTPPLDPWSAMAWTLGRCGAIEASRELASWLHRDVVRARAAAWALGAIAARDRGLEDDVAKALLDAARGGDGGAPLDDALFPFGRGDWSSRPPTSGLAEVARARLGVAGPGRVFAIRALGRAQGGKADDLRTLLADPSCTEDERVEALRALHRMGAAGDAEIAAFLTRSLPSDATKLVSSSFGALRVAVELLGEREASATITTSLRAVLPSGFAPIAAGTSAPVARRIATLRCLAAAALHPGKPGEADVVRCAAHDASLPQKLRAELDTIRDLARLSALDRSEITGERRDLLLRLTREGDVRVRERALAILGKHAEAEEAPESILKALSSKSLGVVASAAQAIVDRPAVAQVASKKSIEEALDPKSPPPDKAGPVEKTTDPKLLEALDGAIARPLEESDAEIKMALAGAVGALRHEKARGFVLRLCGDRIPALRRAGREALTRLDPPGKAPSCNTVEEPGPASPLASVAPVAKTIHLDTDAGALTLQLDPTWAPIAVLRIAELASSGFYDGSPIHRVVPGFVVQLGDPGGDGFGGAHSALRCETAPVPFTLGDVGIALAGRDTGSSQFFVMLGRAPHLDGSYAWIGRATGPWSSIAEGDVVLKARAE